MLKSSLIVQVPVQEPFCCTTVKIKSVKELDSSKSSLPLQDDDPFCLGPVKKLLVKVARGLRVRDGSW